MLSMKKKILFIVFTLYITFNSSAQCAMCRAVLESGEDQSAAEGINDGIMFLMVVPYILVAVIGFYVYRTFSKSKRVKKNR
jgi:heme/copper-type cytochrome/quinol oxidase subunit 2